MPPAFSAEERDRITGILLENGYRLFTTQGLRKTSLEDLVRPAEIAKSTFYVFFDSKEALYLELMARQTADVKRRVIDEGLAKGEGPQDAIRRFLHATLKELAENPLYSRLMTHPEEMSAVQRKLPVERFEELGQDNPATALARYVADRKDELIAEDPSIIVGVLQAILLMPMHGERQIGPNYDKVINLLIEIVSSGLVRHAMNG